MSARGNVAGSERMHVIVLMDANNLLSGSMYQFLSPEQGRREPASLHCPHTVTQPLALTVGLLQK